MRNFTTIGTRIGTRSEIGEDLYRQQAHLRYQVFHGRLKWELPDANPESQLERDQFDHPDTIYVLSGNPVVACCRLIPTQSRHMISELWPGMLNGRHLGSPDTWEISRFAVNTAIPGITGLASISLLQAVHAYGTERGINSLIVVTSACFERFLRKSGVAIERWGVINDRNGQVIIAGEVPLTPELGVQLSRNGKLFHISFSDTALATA